MYGPLTLFAVNNVDASFTRAQLLAARQTAAGSADWTVTGASGPVTFRPFFAIHDERYRLYHPLLA